MLDLEDHPVVLFHHLEIYWEGVGGGLILAVTDRDPMHILNTLAHVHPEDVEGIQLRPHQASRHHLHRDIGQGDGRVRQVNDRGPSQGTAMAKEVREAKTTDDHPHLTHGTMEELHGLMLSRTALSETIVVSVAAWTVIVIDDIGVELGAGAAAGAEVAGENANGEDLWKDGHQLRERGAILHLLPLLMTNGKRLLTHLLMKKALIGHQIEPLQITRRLMRMIKRWVTIIDVYGFPSLP